MWADPVNPYGSYFDDRSLRASGAAQGRTQLGLAPSLAGAMGEANGGYFPTTSEFFTQRMQQTRNTELMMDAMRADPRAGSATDFMVKSMFGNDQKRIQDFYNSAGGRGSAVGTVSGLINMPGISGFLGGDVRSMMFGSSAIASSGGRINGQAAYGQGLAQDMMSRQMFDHTMNSFFTRGGANRMEMTSGLNMDQIGGLMTTGASQGAFSGMNIGDISQIGGKLSSSLNTESADKIKDFIKTASKSMAVLIDAFGQQDMNTLTGLAQKITGMDLSSMRNVNSMQSRLSDIKTTAGVMGVSLGTAFQGVMSGTQFGQQALGLSQYSAGGISSSLYSGSLTMARFMNQDPGFFMHRQSVDDVHQARMTDIAGMSRDARGARASLVEFGAQNGALKGADLDTLRGMVGDMTQSGVGKFDLAYNRITGGSALGAISAQGGARELFDRLSPEGQQQASSSMLKQHGIRQRQLAGRLASRMLNNSSSGTAFGEMLGQFDDGTMGGMLDALENGGSIADIAKIAQGDPGLGLDGDQASAAARKLLGIAGPLGKNAAGSLRGAMGAVRQGTFTKDMITESVRKQQVNAQVQGAIISLQGEDERKIIGFAQNGAQQFFNSLNPDGPDSQVAALAKWRNAGPNKAVWGNLDPSKNAGLYLDPASMGTDANGQLTAAGQDRFAETLNNLPRDMMAKMGITSVANKSGWERTEALRANFSIFSSHMGNPESRMAALQGYTQVLGSNGRSILASTAAMRAQPELTQAALVAGIFADSAYEHGGKMDTQGEYYRNLGRIYAEGGTSLQGKYRAFQKSDLKLLDRAITASNVMGLTSEQAGTLAKIDSARAQKAMNVLDAGMTQFESNAARFTAMGDKDSADKLRAKVDSYKVRKAELAGGQNVQSATEAGKGRISGTIMFGGRRVDVDLTQTLPK